jgi:hypothetical protein
MKLKDICAVSIREECDAAPVAGKFRQLVSVWTVSKKPGAAGRKLGERNACWRLLFDTLGYSPGENNVLPVRRGVQLGAIADLTCAGLAHVTTELQYLAI